MKAKALIIYVLLASALLNRTSRKPRKGLLQSSKKSAPRSLVGKGLAAGLIWGSRLLGFLGGYFLSNGCREDRRYRIYNTNKHFENGNITKLEEQYKANVTMLEAQLEKQEKLFAGTEGAMKKVIEELRSRAQKILINDLSSKI